MNEVIEWLRGPEGEQWSHKFINPCGGPATYQTGGRDTYVGFFSIKEDEEDEEDPVGWLCGYSGPMYWGDMPGDDKLYKEAVDAGIDLS